jgi:V/A-type H+-transporting ATPase subunit I
VQYRNPRFLKPFQMLVTNYHVPEYGTVDPTFFVMFSYLTMFGLMFADVGQGAILLLAGLAGFFLSRRGEERFHNLFALIGWCGFSSVLFGAFFGSYFGLPLLKPVLFDFHGIVTGQGRHDALMNDVFDILAVSIYFGIGIIAIGLLFNWINLLRKRRWESLLLDKGGVAGAWIFSGGVYAAHYMVANGYKHLPSPNALLLLVGVPAIVLFLKHPVLRTVHGRGRRGDATGEGQARQDEPLTPFTLMTVLMEGIVELLDVFSGYLSNTLSFLRVAGLGIAHVSLMSAFFELAHMAGVSWVSMLIVVAGNVLVIGLEGLSAGVQSLRLNYYEFFSKFFTGSGKLYAPISLRIRDV